MVLSAIADISDRKQKEDRIQVALKEKDVLLGRNAPSRQEQSADHPGPTDLQSSRATDHIALDMLRDSQNRIGSMRLVHETLYQSKDFDKSGFPPFSRFAPADARSFIRRQPRRIRLSVEAAQVLLPINAAIPCGLVVNELISNALKHAFPGDRRGEITVKLFAESSGKAVLSVADDGIGIPAEIDMSKTSTLGLQLVTLLAGQLGGTIAMRRSDPTEFVLSFAIEP